MPTTRTLGLTALASCALLAAAPARAQFECPEKGGAPWREVRTAHFVVQTDLGSYQAKELAREVERLFEVVRYGLYRQPPDEPGTIRVVALRSDEEFDLFAPKGAGAFYARTTLEGPTIVVPGTLSDAQRTTIAHELTHHVAARVYARQPAWFSEGLAGYMESVGTSGIGSLPTVGGVPMYLFRSVYPYHGGAGELLTARRIPMEARSYGLAWAMVHFLFNKRPAEFAQFQQRLGKGQDPATAWREVFPEWDPATKGGGEAFDEAVGRHVGSGKFAYRDVHLPPEQPVAERPLTAADAHGVRLSLRWYNRGEPWKVELLRAEIEEALAHDPGNVVALTLRAQEPKADRLALAQQAVAAHPEDPRAWLLLGRSLPDDQLDRRIEALARGAKAGPQDAEVLNEYAWALHQADRSVEGLQPARAAAALQPWNAAILDTFAAVLQDVGQCPPALAIEHRAADVLPEGLTDEERRPYTDRLARLEKQCGAPPAPPAGG